MTTKPSALRPAPRLYLAAPYFARDYVKRVGRGMTRRGYDITSTWLNEATPIGVGTLNAALALTDRAVTEHVRQDFADIDRADALVLFTHDYCQARLNRKERNSGGRLVELGYAIAHGKQCIVIGAPENVFERTLPTFTSWPDAIDWLDKDPA